MDHIPVISPALIEYLERICPDRCPDLSSPERVVWFDAGKVHLVRHLRDVFDEQNQTILEGT